MKIGAIILSRYSSSRLPGKALMTINGKKVLEYIIERLLVVLNKEQIIIATSVESSDQPIADFALNNGIKCFRGSLHNVAERFYNASQVNDWDYAIRINGDNIFVDTQVLAEMIQIIQTNKFEFISNVKNRTFPKGMSIEIVSTEYYKNKLESIIQSDYYKEHVTLYLYEHEEIEKYKYFYNSICPEAAGLQFALDTHEDFQRTEMIINQFSHHHTKYNINQIFHIFENL